MQWAAWCVAAAPRRAPTPPSRRERLEAPPCGRPAGRPAIPKGREEVSPDAAAVGGETPSHSGGLAAQREGGGGRGMAVGPARAHLAPHGRGMDTREGSRWAEGRGGDDDRISGGRRGRHLASPLPWQIAVVGAARLSRIGASQPTRYKKNKCAR